MNVLDFYPVGSIIELLSNEDPNNKIGGEWTLDTSNSILVGQDNNYFSGNINSIVGSDTATAGYPSHTHDNSCRGIVATTGAGGSWGSFTANGSTIQKIHNGTRYYEYYGPARFTASNVGGGGTHENRMKCLQVLRWVRTG